MRIDSQPGENGSNVGVPDASHNLHRMEDMSTERRCPLHSRARATFGAGARGANFPRRRATTCCHYVKSSYSSLDKLTGCA
jgi:hypothetical protein